MKEIGILKRTILGAIVGAIVGACVGLLMSCGDNRGYREPIKTEIIFIDGTKEIIESERGWLTNWDSTEVRVGKRSFSKAALREWRDL